MTFVLQVTVGLFTSSLALLSDSAHVFTDIFGIFMALAAILVAQRAARRPDRTFGMYRTEVFAALANAILLFAVAGWVLYEAASRFTDPPEVPGLPVATVAVVGLAMNVIAFLMLRSGAKESINIRGAYLEVMADMVGSVGVLVSGLVTLAFGWRYADPVIGVAIGLFVLPRAFNLGRHAVRILLQQAPDRIDVTSIIEKINALRESSTRTICTSGHSPRGWKLLPFTSPRSVTPIPQRCSQQPEPCLPRNSNWGTPPYRWNYREATVNARNSPGEMDIPK